MNSLVNQLRQPCGKSTGHGDNCAKGWLCDTCAEKSKAADRIESLEAEVSNMRAAADVTKASWYLTACKMGNAMYNLSHRDDLPSDWKETAAELVKEWDESRKLSGSDSAAGTEKDAEMFLWIEHNKASVKYFNVFDRYIVAVGHNDIGGGKTAREAISAAIAAHNKAGKPS